MKYIAILDSENEFTEEVIDTLKNTGFLGDNPRYAFEILSIDKETWIPVVNVDNSPFDNVQKRKEGKWIETAEDYYKAINEKSGGVDENTPYFDDDIACPNCLSKFSVIDNETERFKCCPNCGSKMSYIPTSSEQE